MNERIRQATNALDLDIDHVTFLFHGSDARGRTAADHVAGQEKSYRAIACLPALICREHHVGDPDNAVASIQDRSHDKSL